MTNFTKTKLTDKGLALLSKEGVSVSITKVKTGNGQYQKDENSGKMTELKSEKQQFEVISATKKSDTTYAIKFAISNKNLAEDYLLTEIGVYANDPDEGEILYAICYAMNENADMIRKFNNVFEFKAIIVLNITVNADGTVKIVSEGGFALVEDVPRLVKVDNNTIFKKEDGTLYAKAGTKIRLEEAKNLSIKNGNKKVTISWEDPDDVVINGIIFAEWKSTRLIMKEGDYPRDENDGIILIDNIVKNKYAETGYTVNNLENGKTYYFALFPCTKDDVYSYYDLNKFTGQPNVFIDSCTNLNAVATDSQIIVSWTDPDATKIIDDSKVSWKKTVLVYKEGTKAPASIEDGIIAVEEEVRNQYKETGYTISNLKNGLDYSFSVFAVSTDDICSVASISVEMYARLIININDESPAGKKVTVTNGTNSIKAVFDSNGKTSVNINWVGKTNVTLDENDGIGEANITIVNFNTEYGITIYPLQLVTFSTGTDEEIAAMIEAHYNNKIDIKDYWAVGDKRKVNLSAMDATGVNESHRAQTVEFAIADFEHDELTTPVNGHTKAAVTLTQVDCLMDAECEMGSRYGNMNMENGYMSSTDKNIGGWTSCDRRNWCNNTYYNALSSEFRKMVKEVNKKTSAGNMSSNIAMTADKIFLLSEIEIFGSRTYSVAGEGAQYQYYKKATANRYKLPKYGSTYNTSSWYERSPCFDIDRAFCRVDYSGSASWDNAINSIGIAPCLCL